MLEGGFSIMKHFIGECTFSLYRRILQYATAFFNPEFDRAAQSDQSGCCAATFWSRVERRHGCPSDLCNLEEDNPCGERFRVALGLICCIVDNNSVILASKECFSRYIDSVQGENFMADQGQLALLRQGREEWNQWRNDCPRVLDLTCAGLSHVCLSDVNLQGANLRGADLSHAGLSGANLSGVDLSEPE
jgi:Pentapeptide repeats (8 copies)